IDIAETQNFKIVFLPFTYTSGYPTPDQQQFPNFVGSPIQQRSQNHIFTAGGALFPMNDRFNLVDAPADPAFNPTGPAFNYTVSDRFSSINNGSALVKMTDKRAT
ncbi:1363_t:CDS:1, partial [Ambispora gerdemannii]